MSVCSCFYFTYFLVSFFSWIYFSFFICIIHFRKFRHLLHALFKVLLYYNFSTIFLMFLFCCEILLWSIKYLPIYVVLSKKWLYLLVLFSFNLLFSTYDYITLPDTDPGRDHSPQTNTASEILQLLKAAPLPH